MKLRRLTVRRMPGFADRGFELLKISEGLNVVTGPNASGKTTACRAIRGVLWPETLRGESPVSLVGEWSDGDDVLHVDLEGTRAEYQRNGVPADPPDLPGPHLAECFTITVDDLFGGSETDTDLGERVAREMAGGYDLAAVWENERLKLPRQHGRREMKSLNEACQQLSQIRDEHERLQREEAELGGLEKQADEARAAQVRLGRIEDVRELLHVRTELREAEAKLGDFPRGMELLTGNEEHDLTQIRDDLELSRRNLDDVTSEIDDAKKTRNETDLPEEGIPAAKLAEQEVQLERLRDLERDLADTGERLRGAGQQVAAVQERLGSLADERGLDSLDVSGLDEIEDFYREAEGLRARQAAVHARTATLGDTEPEADAEALAQGVGILREWLEGEATDRGQSWRSAAVFWVLAAALTAVGLILGISQSLWWFALVIGTACCVVVWLLRPPGSTACRRRCQERFGRLAVEPPGAWDREGVAQQLGALERLLAKSRLAEARREERRSLEEEAHRLKESEQALDERRDELRTSVGLVPRPSDLALVFLVDNLRAYREAKTSHDTLEATQSDLQREHTRCLGEVNIFLGTFGQEACDSYDVARVRLSAVKSRAERHREAAQRLVAGEKAAGAARERIAAFEERKAKLFESVGLSDGDSVGLQERLGRLTEYREMTKELEALSVREKGLVARLEDDPELVCLSLEEAESEAANLEAMANRYEGLTERVAGIRVRVENARRGTRLEEALAQVDKATSCLTERREETALAAAAGYLLATVEAEYQVEGQPEVVRQAGRWFGLFTGGRYELRLAPGEAGADRFRAFDTTAGRGLTLNELSRGTRMQLLLAVRMAFAAASEGSIQLPFVLDEVLSSTDPGRFRAITECLLALVRDGHQVFYFTCQPSDAAAWEQVAGEMGVEGVRRLDLARVRQLEYADPSLLEESAAQVEEVPEPGRRTLEEYAELLGVPSLDPREGASAAHLAHLVEQAEELHRLLRAGVERFGQLDSLASLGGTDAYISDEALERIRATARVIDAFAEAWSVGRGRRVSREILQEAGVSSSYIDRVTNLARDLDWDAQRLVEALGTRKDERAKGYRIGSLDALMEKLSESGHLDFRPTLDEGQAFARIFAAVSDDVQQGVIRAEEVRSLFDRLWALTSSQG